MGLTNHLSIIEGQEACNGYSHCEPYLRDLEQKGNKATIGETGPEALAQVCPILKEVIDCLSPACYAAVFEETTEAMAGVNKNCVEKGFPEPGPGSKPKDGVVGGEEAPKSSPSPSLDPKQGESTSPSDSTVSLGFTLSMPFTLFLALLF
jgi:hypothetical protein